MKHKQEGQRRPCVFTLRPRTAAPPSSGGADWGLCSEEGEKSGEQRNCKTVVLGRACKCPSNECVL